MAPGLGEAGEDLLRLPDFVDEHLGARWARLAEALRCGEIPVALVPVTTNLPVGAWTPLLEAAEARWEQAVSESSEIAECYGPSLWLLEAQVALADLARFAALTQTYPTGAPVALWTLALDLKTRDRDCPVRDVLGWALLAATMDARRSHVHACAMRLVAAWRPVRLGQRGWLYAAAGFTPDEACAAINAGVLSEEQARTLAALRGVPLPAGTAPPVALGAAAGV